MAAGVTPQTMAGDISPAVAESRSLQANAEQLSTLSTKSKWPPERHPEVTLRLKPRGDLGGNFCPPAKCLIISTPQKISDRDMCRNYTPSTSRSFPGI